MRCTWNPAKADRNLRIHGVSFDMAAKIFDDPNHVVTENYFIEEEGEQRYQAIGTSGGLALISARKATAYEKSAYQDQFRR